MFTDLNAYSYYCIDVLREASTMSYKQQELLNNRIKEFRARKAREFPDLSIDIDVDTCTDYENFHISQYPRFYNLTKQQFKYH